MFGYLGGRRCPSSRRIRAPASSSRSRRLPLVLTISALASLLFHWGVLQRDRRRLRLGCCAARWASAAPLALGAAVHIFVGMIEAPLLVRPYLARMQRGELFALMTCGMAGVAGTVMVIYASFLAPVGAERARQYPDRLGDLHARRRSPSPR